MQTKCSSSFRDPDGFIFFKDNEVYRQINPTYFKLYQDLKDKNIGS